MNWTASDSASWLSVSPASGTNGGTVTVTPSITGLAAGTYTADVTVAAAGVSGSPKTIPVTLTLDAPTPPALSCRPPRCRSRRSPAGRARRRRRWRSRTPAAARWTGRRRRARAGWPCRRRAGRTPGTITVTPSTTGLAAGTYTEDITLAAAGATGSPKTVTVTLTLDPPTPPALSVSPAALSFSAAAGRGEPGGQDAVGLEHGRRVAGLDRVGERDLAERVAGERDELRARDGDALDRRARRGHLHARTSRSRRPAPPARRRR